MALTAALLGWMFDGAEMGLFSLVGRSAIRDLLGLTASTSNEDKQLVAFIFSVITAVFLVGAATGGVLFGWLGDRIGRVRAMSLSVVTYALFTGLCGFATEAWQIAVLRFIAALGMGGEWSLGVALVMEVWPNRSRALMAGLIGAAANVGYLLVGFLGLGISQVPDTVRSWLLATGLPQAEVTRLVANDAWRLLMILGVLPALLTFFFRLFVPESEKWEKEQQTGGTNHWATRDLMGVLIGSTGPGLIIYVFAVNFSWQIRAVASVIGVVVATMGYLYPVMQYLKRVNQTATSTHHQSNSTAVRRMLLAACLSGVALMGTWGASQQTPSWAGSLVDQQAAAAKKAAADLKAMQDTKSKDDQKTAEDPKGGSVQKPAGDEKAPVDQKPAGVEKPPTNQISAGAASGITLIFLSLGAITGTILGALVGGWLGRRITYCLLCLLSLGSVWMWASQCNSYGYEFLFFAFLSGTFTASFYGWLPLYLPELFGTNVRATGQGFGFNFGRILAAVGALQTTAIRDLFKADIKLLGLTFPQGYPALLSTISMIYVVGAVIIWFAPETKDKPLPD